MSEKDQELEDEGLGPAVVHTLVLVLLLVVSGGTSVRLVPRAIEAFSEMNLELPKMTQLVLRYHLFAAAAVLLTHVVIWPRGRGQWVNVIVGITLLLLYSATVFVAILRPLMFVTEGIN